MLRIVLVTARPGLLLLRYLEFRSRNKAQKQPYWAYLEPKQVDEPGTAASCRRPRSGRSLAAHCTSWPDYSLRSPVVADPARTPFRMALRSAPSCLRTPWPALDNNRYRLPCPCFWPYRTRSRSAAVGICLSHVAAERGLGSCISSWGRLVRVVHSGDFSGGWDHPSQSKIARQTPLETSSADAPAAMLQVKVGRGPVWHVRLVGWLAD